VHHRKRNFIKGIFPPRSAVIVHSAQSAVAVQGIPSAFALVHSAYFSAFRFRRVLKLKYGFEDRNTRQRYKTHPGHHRQIGFLMFSFNNNQVF
jgi:hypothetical protein